MQEGDAPRPLPERPAPPDLAAAPPRRRQLRGDRLGHRDRRGRGRLRAACATRTAASRSSTTAAADRATTSAAPTRRVPARRSARAYRSNALAQEKTGEVWVDAQLCGGHTRGDFEHAEVAVFVGKNPWMSQSFPRARVVLREIAKDPERSMIVIDPVPHRDREARRLPPAGAPGHRRLVPGRARRRAGPGGPRRRRRSSPSTPNGAEPVLEALARGARRRLRRALRRRRGADPRGRAPHRRRRASRSSRTSASSRRRTARSARTSTSCSGSCTGNFAQARRPAPALVDGAAVRRRAAVGRTPRHRRADHRRARCPCNVIPDEILTDHPERFRAMLVESSNPAHSLADSPAHARGARGARARSS